MMKPKLSSAAPVVAVKAANHSGSFKSLIRLQPDKRADICIDTGNHTAFPPVPLLGLHSRSVRHRVHDAEELSGDRGIDAEAAEREAPR